MESSNPDINGLNNKEELDEIPTVLGNLSLKGAQQ